VLISHLSRNSVAIRAEKVLAMLVESGFVYCCIWVRAFFFLSLELVSADLCYVDRFSTLSPHSKCYQSRASQSWMPFFHISRFAFIHFLRLTRLIGCIC